MGIDKMAKSQRGYKVLLSFCKGSSRPKAVAWPDDLSEKNWLQVVLHQSTY